MTKYKCPSPLCDGGYIFDSNVPRTHCETGRAIMADNDRRALVVVNRNAICLATRVIAAGGIDEGELSDPKYYPCGGSLIHIEGGYVIDPLEPIMTLRGKDVGSLSSILAYCVMLDELLFDGYTASAIESHKRSVLERLETLYKYQMANPSTQSVGCSIRAHGDDYTATIYNKVRQYLLENGIPADG